MGAKSVHDYAISGTGDASLRAVLALLGAQNVTLPSRAVEAGEVGVDVPNANFWKYGGPDGGWEISWMPQGDATQLRSKVAAVKGVSISRDNAPA